MLVRLDKAALDALRELELAAGLRPFRDWTHEERVSLARHASEPRRRPSAYVEDCRRRLDAELRRLEVAARD